MIKLKKLGAAKEEFYVSPSLIETIEQMPDTMITMINGKKYIVAETMEEVLENINEYYKVAGLIVPQIVVHAYHLHGTEDQPFLTT